MTDTVLPYDPGSLPTRPAPLPGEMLVLEVSGLPPHKDRSRSIRNPTHPRYQSFVDLRRAAAREMNGRAWFRGPVGLTLEIRSHASELEYSVIDYVGGIMDTLDGSHGRMFTYLPIVYEDDAADAQRDPTLAIGRTHRRSR